MTPVPPTAGEPEVPVFSRCVIGYRAWRADRHDQLWPISDARRPWVPGINTARCNCDVAGSLRFQWSLVEGRRVLESMPEHEAPAPACECGLYSWRRPRQSWCLDPDYRSLPPVVGAVACWGRLQVHADGFRAEHGCVVTLTYHASADRAALSALMRIGARYRVDIVALDELVAVASRHGESLPDTLRPVEHGEAPADARSPSEEASETFVHAPDALPDDVVMPEIPYNLRPRSTLPPGFQGW